QEFWFFSRQYTSNCSCQTVRISDFSPSRSLPYPLELSRGTTFVSPMLIYSPIPFSPSNLTSWIIQWLGKRRKSRR
ncbi:hypothetical protein PENTCL1PPCAC_19249, partial [Pristionchus entomophagus]